MNENIKQNNTALLVVDVQKGLFERSTPIYQADQVLANINTLIRKVRRTGVPVIFIQHSNDKTLLKDSGDWQLHPRIKPLAGELIIHKRQGNAFEGTSLGDDLEKRNIKALVVTGLVTHGCVKATTLGAIEEGYQVSLVSDAHSNYSTDAPQLIKKWNQILGKKGAQLIETLDVVFTGS